MIIENLAVFLLLVCCKCKDSLDNMKICIFACEAPKVYLFLAWLSPAKALIRLSFVSLLLKFIDISSLYLLIKDSIFHFRLYYAKNIKEKRL